MDSPFSRLDNLSMTHTFTFGVLNDLLDSFAVVTCFSDVPAGSMNWKMFR